MRRLALGLSLTGCLLIPVTSEALGLGSINVRTSLNQPLQARIDLRDISSEDLSGITAILASPSMFERVGIPRPDYLSQLHFKVRRTQSGRAVIQVTTDQPINQPFLDFLLEVNWSGGRILREYTILLNPPNYMQGRAEASAQMPIQAHLTSAAKAPEAASTTASQEAGNLNSGYAAASQPVNRMGVGRNRQEKAHYRVKKGDTLWSISRQEGATPIAGIYQMMIAILRENPRAFIRDNINGLKSGYVLRIPAASEISGIKADQAVAEVDRQNALWHQYAMRMSNKTVSVPITKQAASGPSVSKTTASENVKAVDQGRLRILGTESKGVTASSNPATMPNNKASMEHQLSLAKETDASNKQQITDLRSRVNALQQIVTKEQKLLALKNQELSALQANSGNPVTQTKPGTTVTATVSKPTSQASMPHVAMGNKPSPASSLGTKNEKSEPVAKPMAQPISAKQPKRGFLNTLLNSPNYLMAIGILALLLLTLLWLIVRRSAKAKSQPLVRGLEPALSPHEKTVEPDEPAEVPTVSAVPTAAATLIQAEEESPQSTVDKPDNTQDVDDELGEIPAFHDDDASVNDVESAQIPDVMGEADVYIAYGLFSQAESMLQEALEEDPDNLDYREKLIECYYSASDQTSFTRESKNFYDRLNGNVQDNLQWQRIATLGKVLCPDDALFSGTDTTGMRADDIVSNHPDMGPLDLGEGIESIDQDAYVSDSEEPEHPEVDEALGTELIDLGGQDFGKRDEDVSLGDASDFDMISPPTLITSHEAESPKQAETDQAALDVLDFDVQEIDLSPDVPEITSDKADDHDQSAKLKDEIINIETTESEEEAEAQHADLSEHDLEALDFDLDLPVDEEVGVNDRDISDDSELYPAETVKMGVDETRENLPVEGEVVPKPADNSEQTPTGDGHGNESAEENISSITDGDKVATKLDLARAYIDMGDEEGAQSTLQEVLAEGTHEQREEAESLLKQIK